MPADFETAIYERWLAADVFAPDGAGSRADPAQPPFTIIQPPPNITGALHLGHALTSTLEDVMIRRARMRGRPTLWLPGLDHASIAAQYVLDRILAGEGESRESLGRERYLERMWRFIDETREVMLGQQRRIGASLDWSRLRFTMDDGSARAVRESFARLYREGLAYRTEALINWCPGCRTSVSDLEVIPTPETGTIWTIRYHLIDEASGAPSDRECDQRGDDPPGDDPRRHRGRGPPRRPALPGARRAAGPDPVRRARRPDHRRRGGRARIRDRRAQDHPRPRSRRLRDGPPSRPADDHDPGRRRHDQRARRRLRRARPLRGAPKRILADLEARGDLEGARPHEMLIGRCQRSNDVVEPRLKTQWFIRTGPLAAAALAATRSGRTTIVPARFEKVWEHWMTSIHDWNVSRQLWWGHRIPAWYCPDGHVTVTADAGRPGRLRGVRPPGERRWPRIRTSSTPGSAPGCGRSRPSAGPTTRLTCAAIYPTTVMETGYDIIFFWVARMMMLGIHLTGDVPFGTVYLHGLVKDPYGQRMSKTKGNVVDPLEAISESGADALRFALVNGTSPGNDQKFSQERLENARNFANKLWNAARFVLGARPASIAADAPRAGAGSGPARSRRPLAAVADRGDRRPRSTRRWTRSRSARRPVRSTRRPGTSSATGVSSWPRSAWRTRRLPAEDREATWWTLVEALDALLRLLHPFMPFVTEAIWAATAARGRRPELLIVADWPDPAAWAAARDARSEAAVDRLRALVTEIRNARSTARIPPGANRPGDILVPAELADTFDALAPAIERLARLRPLVRHVDRAAFLAAQPPGSLAVIAGDLEARIGAESADADSAAAERVRLERELADAERLLAAARARLANDAFTSRAPADIVAGARAREAELAGQVARLRERLVG